MVNDKIHQREMKKFAIYQSLKEKMKAGIEPEATGGPGTLSDLSMEELSFLQTQVALEIQNRMGL